MLLEFLFVIKVSTNKLILNYKLTEINTKYDNEIDLIEFFKILWEGKWKFIAITFVAVVIGVGYNVAKPTSYEVSIPIQSSNQSVFVSYTSLNELLSDEGMIFNEITNPNGYVISSDSVFTMFNSEFNDYEEIINAVSTSKFVQQSIKDLDDDDKQTALIKFAKAFNLNAPSTNVGNWTLTFEWHDYTEGLRLLDDAIRQTLLNTKNLLISNINDLADVIDIRHSRKLEKLYNQLSFIEQNQIYKNTKRIKYLIEQSAIARELGIEKNKIDSNALAQIPEIAISLNPTDIPYYLRGYKAIEKEISLIQNRSEEDNLMAADGYLQIKEEIIVLENNLSSSHLRVASEVMSNEIPNDWVEFNLALADVKSQKKSKLYVALSVVLGGMVGAMYVLISNIIRKRKEQLVKA